MTAKAALCKAFLDGRTLNVKNGITEVGLSNIPREVSRMVERPFNVKLKRIKREGKSRYGQPVIWYDYRLEFSLENAPGIQLMREYVAKQKENTLIKTTKQFKQMELL